MAGNITDSTLLEYRRAVKLCIRSGKDKTAYSVLQHALSDYPEDPFILSFYGVLETKMDKKYKSGIENCKKAVTLLQNKPSTATSFPVLYLNLGRAYMAAGRRKEALISFYAGLKYGKNHEIVKELEMVGMRKTPTLPFLGRSNLINKFMGLMLHRFKNIPQKNRSLPAFMVQKRNP